MTKRPELPADFRLQRDSTGAPRVSSSWTAVMTEAVGHLQRIIGIDTTNPPGHDLQLARYVGKALDAEQIQNRVLEIAPHRGAIVAHLRGNGDAPPVLIGAHTHTAPVDTREWSVPAFEGTVRDGCVYGRGVAANKGMLVANLAAFLCVKRSVLDAGATLHRDIIFVAAADEQAEGDEGMRWLIGNCPDLIRAEYALNDCGRIRTVDGQPQYALVQAAEQLSRSVVITARGTDGPAAMSIRDSAVFRLARAMTRIGAYQAPRQASSAIAERISEMAHVWPQSAEADVLASMVSEETSVAKQAADFVAGDSGFDAALSAGDERHVSPDEARATLRVRTLPGAHIDDVVTQLRRLIDDSAITVAVADALPADHTSLMYTAIAGAIAELDPIIEVVSYPSSRASEAARLRTLGTQTFGLLPFPLDAPSEVRTRAHDERLPLASLEFGIRVIVGVLRRMTLPVS